MLWLNWNMPGTGPKTSSWPLAMPPQWCMTLLRSWRLLVMSSCKASKPRLDKIWNPMFLAGLKWSIKVNVFTPMTNLAEKRNMSQRPIRRPVNEDLGMKFYVHRHWALLTLCSKEIRAERCPNLLNHLKHKGGEIWICVDEKNFVVDKAPNCQNRRVLTYEPAEVPAVFGPKIGSPPWCWGQWRHVMPLRQGWVADQCGRVPGRPKRCCDAMDTAALPFTILELICIVGATNSATESLNT